MHDGAPGSAEGQEDATKAMIGRLITDQEILVAIRRASGLWLHRTCKGTMQRDCPVRSTHLECSPESGRARRVGQPPLLSRVEQRPAVSWVRVVSGSKDYRSEDIGPFVYRYWSITL